MLKLSRWILPLLTFLGVLWGLGFDLPYPNYGDEITIVRHGMMMGSGDLNPHFPVNGHLWFYAVFVCQVLLVMAGLWSGAIQNLAQIHYQVFWDPTLFYIAPRILVAFLSAGCVFWTGEIGRKFSENTGLFASLGLMFFGPFFYQSHFATTDVPLIFLVLWFLNQAVRDKPNLSVMAVLAGLALSIKLNAAPVLAIWLWVYFREVKRKNIVRDLPGAIGWGAAAFFLTSPFLLIDFKETLRALNFFDQVVFKDQAGVSDFFYYARVLYRSLGPGLLVVTVAGWAAALHAFAQKKQAHFKKGITLLIFAGLYLFLIQSAGFKATRWLIPFWAVACLGLGFAADWSLKNFKQRYVPAFLALLVLFLGFPALKITGALLKYFPHEKPTLQLVRWFDAQVPSGTSVYLCSGIKLDPDRKTLLTRIALWEADGSAHAAGLAQLYRLQLNSGLERRPHSSYRLVNNSKFYFLGADSFQVTKSREQPDWASSKPAYVVMYAGDVPRFSQALGQRYVLLQTLPGYRDARLEGLNLLSYEYDRRDILVFKRRS